MSPLTQISVTTAARFVARAPWWGGDLQTLRNYLSPRARRAPAPPARPIKLTTDDDSGDILLGLLSEPADEADERPLIVLLHGLGGSATSPYMRQAAAWFVARGHPVLRLNLRGAGDSGATCRLDYHAGLSADLGAALRGLPAEPARHGVVAVGFSLGGNILLKYLGETGDRSGLLAAASVSAPIDLARTSRNIRRPRNSLYQYALLRDFVRQVLRPGAVLDPKQRAAVRAARDFYEIDNTFVAPRNGFADADDYYRRAMALPYLTSIKIPTLVVQAGDDPIVPSASYRQVDWRANRNLYPLITEGGGHVGFHGPRGIYYLDRIADLVKKVT